MKRKLIGIIAIHFNSEFRNLIRKKYHFVELYLVKKVYLCRNFLIWNKQ